jgi:hypothetical protein
MVTKNWDDDKLVAWGYTSILVETRGFLLNGRNGRRSPPKTRGPALQKSVAGTARFSRFPVQPSDHVRDHLRNFSDFAAVRPTDHHAHAAPALEATLTSCASRRPT